MLFGSEEKIPKVRVGSKWSRKRHLIGLESGDMTKSTRASRQGSKEESRRI